MRALARLGLGLGILLPQLAFAAASETNVRTAAQHGLDYLGQNTTAWQKQNNCYGCHVQAVTLEGLAVGRSHQYEVSNQVMGEVVDGMLRLPGGARTPEGLSHPGFPRTAKTFGAEAFARYDALVDRRLADDLLRVSRELLAFQDKDGAVHGDHEAHPVTTGVMQSTFQAAQAWRQSYAHTADNMWLAPLRSAEGFMARTARSWEGHPEKVYLQDVNYAVMGMLSAGAAPSEADVAKLLRFLEQRQNRDGGWGFGDGTSDAYATGQTVYTLRLAGRTEQDAAVARGLAWLVAHQNRDGSWGAGGSARAEAMWGVMGLVSVDVLSVSLSGIQDGEHVAPVQVLTAEASDNQGQAVKGLELRIDDLAVQSAAGPKLAFRWDTSKLKEGVHTVDVIATNAKGQTSRRRLEVYAGNVFLTQVGTRFTDGGTQVTLRNIAPESAKGTIKLEVFADEGAKGAAPVFAQQQGSAHGPMAFFFAGKSKEGKPLPAGRYRAVLSYSDEAGRALQREETVFVHDSPEAQQARYAEVEGRLGLAKDGAQAANAEVELVDDKGIVVQRTRSNEEGQYRFKGVSEGKYKVRFAKQGFAASEASVSAAPAAAPAKADAVFR